MIIWVAMFLLASFSVAVSSYAIKNRSKLTDLESLLSKRMMQLERELASINDVSIGVGQRVISVEKNLNVIAAEQERIQSTTDYQAYEQAEHLVSNGGDTQLLTEKFGLSDSEAQLMSLLQKKSEVQAVQ